MHPLHCHSHKKKGPGKPSPHQTEKAKDLSSAQSSGRQLPATGKRLLAVFHFTEQLLDSGRHLFAARTGKTNHAFVI